MLRIFIPTLNRVNKQHTWNALPPAARAVTSIVCTKEEAPAHLALGRSVLVCDKMGISAVRQFVLDTAKKNGWDKVVMMDDDMRHVQRRRDDGKITDCSPAEVMEALQWIETTLDEVPHCGWGVRQLAYAAPVTQSHMSGRMMYCLAYNVPVVFANKASFILGPESWWCMEDFHMTLQLMKAGFNNRVSLEWRCTMGTSNATGGCSTWRTLERHNASALRLKELHSEYVKVVEKPAWEGMEGATRQDVVISWRNAVGHNARVKAAAEAEALRQKSLKTAVKGKV